MAFKKIALRVRFEKSNRRVLRQTPSDVIRTDKKVKFGHWGEPLLRGPESRKHSPLDYHYLKAGRLL
jgi:hypothetical protein